MPSKGVTKSVREVVNPVTGKMCTGKESVEVINSFFTNIGPNLNNKLPPSSDTNTIQESDVSLENIEILSNEKVAALVKDIDICKSSGVTDVSSRLLKDGFIALIEQLTFILNLSLKTSVFPDVWKVARVRPIPKTGDLTNVNNIRPISLTALPGKLLERYIHTNLVYFLEENKLLCKNQGGFRKKRSTIQTVYHLVNDIANAILNNSKLSLAVYLDLAKAFDCINHDFLLRKLHMIGIRGIFDKSFSRSCVSNLSLYIFGDVVEHVEHYEYLGIIVDDKLSFKNYSIKCSNRANNKIYQLKKIRGCITTKCALTIYKSMVLPLVEYGGLFLDTCTDNVQTKIQRLQNRTLRIIYKQDNYVNMYDLHNTANLLPLKLRREIALLKIMFSKIQDRQGLQLRELTTRAHDGPIMNVSKPASSRYIKSVAYRGPTTWNRLKPELRCLRDKNSFVSAIKCYFWETYRTLNIG